MTGGVWNECVNLFSDLNENMEIIIIPTKENDVTFAQLASKVYTDWFENKRDDIGDMTVGDYLEYRLKNAGYKLGKDQKMYFDAQWDRTEILI